MAVHPASFELDAYVVDVLMPDLAGHDRAPSAFLVYLHLWRRTDGGRRATGELGLATIAEQTGVSKRSVQLALARLRKRQLVASERGSPSGGHSYRVKKPWIRPAKR